jgi:ubiquinone biosynthesis protein
MGQLVAVLGLEQFVPFHHRLLHHGVDAAPPSAAERLRMALGELGATFIKLGQILSTRADLLPPVYQAELAKLQDQAPPVPVAAIRAAIEEELGRPVEEAFAFFDPEPLAAASIG